MRGNVLFPVVAALFFVATSAGFAQLQTGHSTNPTSSGAVPFLFDDNRIFVELSFLRPDGRLRQALAFVDIGTPELVLSEELGKELEIGQKKSVVFALGKLQIQVPASAVETGAGKSRTGPHGKATELVEAVLPGAVMKAYRVVFDYGKRTLAFEAPDVAEPAGMPVPCRVNDETGLISVSALVAGQSYALAVDVGSAYTWVRDAVARQWLRGHPGWERGTGAVGEANMQTQPGGAESRATMLRLPQVRLASLDLQQVGVVGIAPGAPPFPPVPGKGMVSGDFFDWYSRKAPEPVIGWLGANVLRDFRITIDYPHFMTYWQRESAGPGNGLDQVGITLETRDAETGYFIAGIARKDGKPTVDGVKVGDRLVQVDDLPLSIASRGGIFDALGGKPGTSHVLLLERNGKRFTVRARTTAF